MNLIFPDTKAVFSVMLTDVAMTLNQMKFSNYYFHPGQIDEIKSKKDQVSNLFKQWVSDIVDLSEFNYVYPVSGITQAIDHCIGCSSFEFQQFKGEYGWPKLQNQSIEVISNVSELDPNKILYFSNPHSPTGNFDERWDQIINSNSQIYLDCAFIGTTQKKKININNNVKKVFFSLNKSYGLNLFRTGLYFSREKDDNFSDLIDKFSYFNFYQLDIIEKMIKTFNVDSLYNRLVPYQNQICKTYQLNPSDSVILATTYNQEFDKFKRANGINRICLSSLYYQMNVPTLYNPGCF